MLCNTSFILMQPHDVDEEHSQRSSASRLHVVAVCCEFKCLSLQESFIQIMRHLDIRRHVTKKR
jgi:hypothetical protein